MVGGTLSVLRRLDLRGAGQTVADSVPGCLGRLLFSFLFGPALALAVRLRANPHERPEGLLVVRPALLDVVLGYPEDLGRCQLLEGGLPVQPRAEARRPRDNWVKQPVHERVRGLEAAIQVDGA